MTRQKGFILTCFLMSGLFLYAQDKPSEIIVQGKISDSSSGEALSGASLYIVELKQGAVADEDGV